MQTKKSADWIDSHSRRIASKNPILIFQMVNFLYLIIDNPFLTNSMLRVNGIYTHNTAILKANDNLGIFLFSLSKILFGKLLSNVFCMIFYLKLFAAFIFSRMLYLWLALLETKGLTLRIYLDFDCSRFIIIKRFW